LCSLGPTLAQARIASCFIFGRGEDPSTPQGLMALGRELGVEDPESLASALSAKDRLRANTEEALARGVWGVPTLEIGGELFWGADSFPMVLYYLADPGLFETPEMQRMAALPIGAARTL
jgi:2-hydroxychromene-2-carboxylate isomerase